MEEQTDYIDISEFTKRFNHRFELIEQTNDKLKNLDDEFNLKLSKIKGNMDKEIKEFRLQIEELSLEVNELIKSIFSMGNVLKEKLQNHDFELLKELVDNWKLEEFVNKNELEKSFNNYSEWFSSVLTWFSEAIPHLMCFIDGSFVVRDCNNKPGDNIMFRNLLFFCAMNLCSS